VRAIEKATRSELDTLPEQSRSSALAAVALDLARRLDGDPADTAAVLLARELRQTLAYLHGRQPEDLGGEVERFLGRIAASDVGDAED